MASDVLKLFYAIASSLFFYVLTKLLKFGCPTSEYNAVTAPPSIGNETHQDQLSSVEKDVREETISQEETTLRKDRMGGYMSKSCISLDEAPELEEYDLVRVIGRGSYSTVFMVEKRDSGELFALKVMSKFGIARREDLHCVITEQRVLQLGLSCDFLVGFHASFESSKRFYLVMEIARGGDLMYYLQQMGKLEEEHARFYSAEICLALNFLHGKGIIYRDLKLDNVLLDHEGHIKLADFGMCREGINGEHQYAKTLCGTPNYLSPEMLRGHGYGFSVDWWALGVLLYEMLAGASPFSVNGDPIVLQGDATDLVREIFSKDIAIPSFISEKARQILRAFLERNPAERLGCHPETGFADICNHPFFEDLDWDRLSSKLIPPPYKPRLSANRDSRCFDPCFTSEPVEIPDDESDSLNVTLDSGSFSTFNYEASPSGSWEQATSSSSACRWSPPAFGYSYAEELEAEY